MIDMDGLDYIIVLKFAVRWWTRSFLLLSTGRHKYAAR